LIPGTKLVRGDVGTEAKAVGNIHCTRLNIHSFSKIFLPTERQLLSLSSDHVNTPRMIIFNIYNILKLIVLNEHAQQEKLNNV
jgi:hypothetical protein